MSGARPPACRGRKALQRPGKKELSRCLPICLLSCRLDPFCSVRELSIRGTGEVERTGVSNHVPENHRAQEFIGCKIDWKEGKDVTVEQVCVRVCVCLCVEDTVANGGVIFFLKTLMRRAVTVPRAI